MSPCKILCRRKRQERRGRNVTCISKESPHSAAPIPVFVPHCPASFLVPCGLQPPAATDGSRWGSRTIQDAGLAFRVTPTDWFPSQLDSFTIIGRVPLHPIIPIPVHNPPDVLYGHRRTRILCRVDWRGLPLHTHYAGISVIYNATPRVASYAPTLLPLECS